MLKRAMLVIMLVIGTHIPMPVLAASSEPLPQSSGQFVSLEEDLQLLGVFSKELELLKQQMLEMQRTFNAHERGYYTSIEHAQIESLLFRYRTIRASLWSMVHRHYDSMDALKEKRSQARSFLIGYNAALNLAHYSSLLVSTFIDNQQVIDKLNEPYHGLGISAGSYDEFMDRLTSPRNIQSLKVAWTLFFEELRDHQSPLYQLQQSEPEYDRLIDSATHLHASAEQQVRFILKKRSLISPKLENMLRQNAVASVAQESVKLFGEKLYAIRGLIYTMVSHAKSPLAGNMRFTAKQVKKIRSMLQPGDILLTYSSGYMSNVFLPGKFKHGITYVGSPEQREELKLGGEELARLSVTKRAKFGKDIRQRNLPSGQPADLIEAVAPGVIFNSLDEVLDNHLGRLLVLRPRISDEERRKALTTVFLLLGDDYDFSFDFDNGARQCCTEVIYRALNGSHNIHFSLVPRIGLQTLSADDIVHHHMLDQGHSFEFVMLATRGSGGGAKIRTGSAGQSELVSLMKKNDLAISFAQ